VGESFGNPTGPRISTRVSRNLGTPCSFAGTTVIRKRLRIITADGQLDTKNCDQQRECTVIATPILNPTPCPPLNCSLHPRVHRRLSATNRPGIIRRRNPDRKSTRIVRDARWGIRYMAGTAGRSFLRTVSNVGSKGTNCLNRPISTLKDPTDRDCARIQAVRPVRGAAKPETTARTRDL